MATSAELTDEQIDRIMDSLQLDNEDDTTLMVGLKACRQRPTESTLVIKKLLKSLATSGMAKLGNELSELACSLPAIVTFLFTSNTDPSLWNILLELRGALADLLRSSHAGVVIRAARCMQLMTVMWSKRPSAAEGGQDVDVTASNNEEDTDLPKGHPSLRGAMVREEASRTLDKLIGALWTRSRSDVSLPVLLAIVNLLGRLARVRPVWLPKIVPALIDLYDSFTGGATGISFVHLTHTLEKQLEGLMENGAAEKYYPLIVESLKKGRAGGYIGTSSSSAAAASAKRKKPTAEDEDEDDAALAKVGTKKLKSGSTAAVADIDVCKTPLALATEVVLHVLLTKGDQIQRSLETWRPSTSSAGAVRDPRRADAAEETKTTPTTEQVVPFSLNARSLSEIEVKSLLKVQLARLLDSPAGASGERKKTKLREFVRLINLLCSPSGDSEDVAGEVLLDFCFENLSEYLSVLLYWLRLVWIESRGVTPGGKYEQIYVAILGRLQEVVIDQPPEWDVYLQRFFTSVPELSGQSHLTLLGWICKENQSSRIAGLALLEGLLLGRPALTEQLTDLLLSLCTADDTDATSSVERHAAIVVIDRLMRVERIAPLIRRAAETSLDACSIYNVDLALHVALRTDLTSLLARKYNEGFSPQVQQHCLAQIARIPLDTQVIRNIISLPITQNEPWGIFLEKLVEALCKQNALGELVTSALENIEKGRWPAKLLDRIIVNFEGVSIDVVLSAMTTFLSVIDPSVAEEKPAALSLIAKVADKFGGSCLLVQLHLISSVPLKRLVDYIQLCLTMLKPDVIASALQTLVAAAEWPPMLMRTLIQSVTLHRSMTGLVVGLLARLIGREVWSSKLWEGFIRCVRTLGVSSHALLLQLPPQQLTALLEAVSEMRPAFLAYLRQQSGAIQTKYASLLMEGDNDKEREGKNEGEGEGEGEGEISLIR